MDNNNETNIENTQETNGYYIDNTAAFTAQPMEASILASDEEKKQKMGLSIASMVIGILSMTLCCVFGSVLGILGLIFGIIALVKRHAGTGMAIAGVITSILGFLVGIFMIFYVMVIGFAVNSVTNEIEPYLMQEQEIQRYIDKNNIDLDDIDLDDIDLNEIKPLLKALEKNQY